jgi:hypothetical protein
MAEHLIVTSPAGGDASGTLGNLNVDKLRGIPISAAAPAAGQSLAFDGTSWKPTTITGGGGSSITIGALDAQTPASDGAVVSGTALFLQSASSTNPGVVNTVGQVFQGNKTVMNSSNDAYFGLVTQASGKGAYYSADSQASGFQGIQGKVNGTIQWVIGRTNNAHGGVNIYAGAFGSVRVANFADTADVTFFGHINLTTAKNIVIPTTGSGVMIGTANTQKMAFWAATPTVQPSGNVSAALVTIGLISAPTIAQADITNLTTDLGTINTSLSGKISNITGLVTAGANVTVTGSGTSGSPYIISAGAGASALTQTTTKTGAYSAAINELVITDASAGSFTVSLPSAPTDKSIVAVKKTDSVTANPITVACSGTDTFLTSGATTTTITATGQVSSYMYNAALGKWTGISNDLPISQVVDAFSAQSIFGNKTFSNTTTDSTVVISTSAASAGAYLNINSTSDQFHGIQGRVGGSMKWLLGRSGHNTDAVYLYTNFLRAASWDTSQNMTAYGNITIGSSKTLTLSGASGKITTPALQINTASAPTVGYVWTATDTSGNGTWQAVSGSGTVTSVSVVSANGFAGSVATSTTTPAITITTSITGLLKGNGTAISAATAGTDYLSPTGTETMSNKRWTRRVVTTTQSATPSINTDNGDIFSITALAQAITGFTVTGTAAAGDSVIIEITDDGTGRAITWGTSFESSGTITLPATTVAGVKLQVGFTRNTVTSKWRIAGIS